MRVRARERVRVRGAAAARARAHHHLRASLAQGVTAEEESLQRSVGRDGGAQRGGAGSLHVVVLEAQRADARTVRGVAEGGGEGGGAAGAQPTAIEAQGCERAAPREEDCGELPCARLADARVAHVEAAQRAAWHEGGEEGRDAVVVTAAELLVGAQVERLHGGVQGEGRAELLALREGVEAEVEVADRHVGRAQQAP